MKARDIVLGDCRVAVLTDGGRLVGLGRIWIGETLVRSGRLPIGPASQTFGGLELRELELLGVEREGDGWRIASNALLAPLPVKLMRDHSFDAIHDTSDWDASEPTPEGRLDVVLAPAEDEFNGVRMAGLSYRYEYDSEKVPLFYLLDRASWELGGDIAGATAVSQSSCSPPVVTFGPDTAWTTEGVIHWTDGASLANPVMTHNLPRWASHQAFDFQYKGEAALAGVFERVGLIRSLLRREPHKAELKTFDKHIFDEALKHVTPAKSILLARGVRREVDHRNLWTWILQEVHERARAEFGLAAEPLVPWVSQNYWENFTFESYRKDLLPAAEAIGAKGVFIDNVHRSAMTDDCPHPGVFHWNMCCGHEYEVAGRLGGAEGLKVLVDECRQRGIDVFSWTNNDQALSSPLNASERDEDRQWYVKMECTRLKYGGAYTNVFSIWDFKSDGARRNWIDSLKRTRDRTGLNGYLFDSFYNLGFMPVSYSGGRPSTMWRELLGAFKELQDAGIHFKIESFGPFGCVMHGCPTSYNVENIFACYGVGLGSGYTTVPSSGPLRQTLPSAASVLYYVLAHMTNPNLPLFVDGKRIDTVWTDAHKRALADYNAQYPHMARRYLQADGQAVLWHDAEGRLATLWNFTDRSVSLPGQVTDLTAGQAMGPADRYDLKACHTYRIAADELPVEVKAGESVL